MITLKEAALTIIEKMADDSTAEEIMYEINFISQVLQGQEDVKKGRTISTEDLLKRVKTWGK